MSSLPVGSGRARLGVSLMFFTNGVLMAALLERLGVLDEAGVDAEAVRATGRTPLLGGGVEVGEVRAALP